jgi:phosphonate transport system substrate-binding protein
MVYKRFAVALVLISFIASGTVSAAELILDSRFQDVDGDLVADTPSNPKRLVDPSTLIFAYTPLEDPGVSTGATARGCPRRRCKLPLSPRAVAYPAT